jgi:hypothetical protein
VLPITRGMQIVGTAGPALTTVDAHNASEIIKISGAAGAVSITGLTLTRGHASAGNHGSGIDSIAPQLTLSEDSFTANTSGGAGTSGYGAVAIGAPKTGTLTVTNSTFTRNAAGGEGGSAKGSGEGSGGAIAFFSNGTLTVTGSTFTENTAGGNGGPEASSGFGRGGAIFAGGDDIVSIASSTFTSNKAGGVGGSGGASGRGEGGAVDFRAAATGDTLAVGGSTFSGNQAGGANVGAGGNGGEGVGGAISAAGKGSANLTNDTLVGNSVGGPVGAILGGGSEGGGLNTEIPAVLLNDTLDGNAAIGGEPGAAEAGGNVSAKPGPITLKNTIVVAGSAVSGRNCSGTVTSAGHNIDDANATECGLHGGLGDIVASPLLGPLQNNGGPTQTQALLAGSPAIEAGDNNGCPATDQRGVLRPQGAVCDIGAYEVAPPTAATGGATTVRTSSATLTGLATNPDALGATMFFQWGRTRSYGGQTAAQALAPGGATAFSAGLSSLTPDVTYHFRAVVINPDGTTVGSDQAFTTLSPPPIKRPPRLAILTGLSETNSVFAVNFASTPLTGRTTRRHPRGTVFMFRLSQAATVRITIQTTARGRRVHGKCRAETKRLRRRPRCTRVLTVATLTRVARKGPNKVRFSGSINGRALSPRRYKAVFTAIDAAGASPPQSLSFTIVRR